MPVYNYNAIDSAGKKRAGAVDARTKASAVGLLKEQSLYVVSLDEQRNTVVDQLLSIRGIPETEIVAFTRQMSTMISAGLPIARAMQVLGDQTRNKKMRQLLFNTLRDIEGGASFSSSIAKFPHVFSDTYVALIKAGEASGKLEEILKRLAETLEAQREFKARFKGAMIYPAIIFMAMIGVFVLMMVFVIPKLSEMYVSMGVTLPAITQFMINISDFMVKFWYLLIIGFVGMFFAFKAYAATDGGKNLIYSLLGRAPIFGKILRQRDLTEFTRTLSLLIGSGIAIVQALNIVAKVVAFPDYKAGALSAAKTVEKGGSLSSYLKQDKTFPTLLGQMASVGEETGQLDEVLERIGSYYASETDHAVKGLSSALEPIILIVLGGLVGLLIVSIITPIYQITSSL